MTTSIGQNLNLFAQLISCAQDINFLTFDTRLNCIRASDSEDPIIKQIFDLEEEYQKKMRDLLDLDKPIVMTGKLGFLWIAEGEKDSFGELIYIHVIGPIFTEEISTNSLKEALSRLKLPASAKRDFLPFLQKIPFVPLTRFLEYGLMLHYCLHEEKIAISDLLYEEFSKSTKKVQNKTVAESHGSWAIEQKMVRLISEGNPDFHKLFGRPASAVNLGDFNLGDPIRYFKDMIIVSITLCSRAAISGGLSPEICYTLSDKYIKGLEDETTIEGIANLNKIMQNDFVERVHRLKISSGNSQHIKKCRDYIQLHVEEKITEVSLAKLCGYSPAYLSRKFREETGLTVKEYIMKEKIEQSKIMLISDKKSVRDITEQLGFESQSYYGKKFKEITGMTPLQFRNQGTHIQ